MSIFVTIYNYRAHNYFITIVMKFRNYFPSSTHQSSHGRLGAQPLQGNTDDCVVCVGFCCFSSTSWHTLLVCRHSHREHEPALTADATSRSVAFGFEYRSTCHCHGTSCSCLEHSSDSVPRPKDTAFFPQLLRSNPVAHTFCTRAYSALYVI